MLTPNNEYELFLEDFHFITAEGLRMAKWKLTQETLVDDLGRMGKVFLGSNVLFLIGNPA